MWGHEGGSEGGKGGMGGGGWSCMFSPTERYLSQFRVIFLASKVRVRRVFRLSFLQASFSWSFRFLIDINVAILAQYKGILQLTIGSNVCIRSFQRFFQNFTLGWKMSLVGNELGCFVESVFV